MTYVVFFILLSTYCNRKNLHRSLVIGLLEVYPLFLNWDNYTTHVTHKHTTVLWPFFPGLPGWAGARRELLDFVVQGKINMINRGRHNDHLAGRHSIWTNQCPPPPSPHIFRGRMPFLLLSQQCQSTAHVNCLLFVILYQFIRTKGISTDYWWQVIEDCKFNDKWSK